MMNKTNDPLNTELNYLVLPADIQQKIKNAFNITIEKADIIDRTATPDAFPLGGGRKALMLEYGVACIDMDEKGFAWVFTHHVAYAKCKNQCYTCESLQAVKDMIIYDNNVYCSANCREGLPLVPVPVPVPDPVTVLDSE